ncbi:MAG: DUF4493 domain-containing protein [Bacteroidales bacterium]|nr:DUF4493 domain-containing protein [Bacteroidales bacterium]
MKFFKASLLIVLMAALCASCGKDAYDFGGGSAKFALSADYTTSAVGTKSGEELSLDVNDFTLEVFNSSGVKFKKWKYGDIKDEKVRMNKGNFTAHAFYGDSLAVGFDAIYFAGKSTFAVDGQSTTAVSMVCRMANVKVAVEWGDNVKADYSDWSVKIYREGKSGSLSFGKDETRSGYIPAGDIKMDITLIDGNGNTRVYSPKAIACAANDFITFKIDTKEAAKEEVTISFQLVTGTDDKIETVVIPAALVAKDAPSFEAVGFTNNAVSFVEASGVEGDLYVGITAPAFIEKCVLVSQSEFLPSNWPQEIDLLDSNEELLSTIRAYGIKWSLSKGESRYGIVSFAELTKRLRMVGENVNKFTLRVTDVKGKVSEIELTLNLVGATVAINAIPDYDMWATKAYIEVTTNATDASQFVIEAMDGTSAVALNTEFVSRTSDVSRFMVTGLVPATAYSFRANYSNGLKYTEQTAGTTEAAQQLVNGDMESWSNTKYNTYGLKSIYLYYPGNSASDKAWGTKNTLTMDGVEDGTSSGTTNQVTAYRWNSCTIPTTDAVSGNAAEIRTMAMSRVGLGGTDVGSGLFWAEKAVAEAVQKDYRVYAGTLYTGKTDVTASAETPDKLGISHQSRPASLTFSYKYAPYNGDNCKVYAKLYNAAGEEIASTDEFTTAATVSGYTEYTLNFKYSRMDSKAASAFVIFQSGVNEGINEKWEYVAFVDGSYDANPWSLDSFVGSVLKVDNVILNY